MDPKKIAKLILPISRDRLGINENEEVSPSADRLNAALEKLGKHISADCNANYGYYWEAFDILVKSAGIDFAKKFIIAELLDAHVEEYPAFINELEIALMKYFGGDPEIWEAWMLYLGQDGAAAEIGCKAGKYYTHQCDWVRLMLGLDLPIDWSKALSEAIEIHGMDEELMASLNKKKPALDAPDALTDDDDWHTENTEGFIPELYYKVHGEPQ